METYIVRLWLPDRPGALGQVASRIGAVRGEIVGIDILERGAGRAIDELAVQLPAGDASLLELMISEMRCVDGVDVEEVRVVDGTTHDPRADALDIAALVVGAGDREDLLEALVAHGRAFLGSTWAAVVDIDGRCVAASDGDAPTDSWTVAFVEGSRASRVLDLPDSGPDDVIWSPLPAVGLALVLGRDGSAFRARERRQVASLARIAAARLVDFAKRSHPAGQRSDPTPGPLHRP